MRNKKILSTVVAGALVATTMSVPVMAADGGTLNVDVDTKSAVIKVVVPTSLEIAVDQFESVDAGAQIYSTPFTMTNNSGVGVKVNVESTATATAGLVASVGAVEASTSTSGEAWLAVAAQTEAGKYGAEIGDLTEASPNVATFDGTSKKASQTYYLAKGTGEVEYKMLYPAAAGKVGDVSYAQFYQLTPVALGSSTEQDDLDDAIAVGVVYVDTTTAANGNTLTRVEKGGSHTYASGETYYTAATTVTEAKDVAATTPYVYAGTENAGGASAFRYIGKLSEAKTTSWSKADISQISIKYDIEGVTASTFDEANKNCTYGLYTTPAAPSIATTDYTVDPESNTEIPVNLGAASTGAKGVKSVTWEGEELINSDNDAKYENGKVIIDASVGNYFDQQGLLPATLTITFDMNDADAEAVTVDVTLKK